MQTHIQLYIRIHKELQTFRHILEQKDYTFIAWKFLKEVYFIIKINREYKRYKLSSQQTVTII